MLRMIHKECLRLSPHAPIARPLFKIMVRVAPYVRFREREMHEGGDQQDTLGGEKSGLLTMMALFRVPGLVPAP